MIDFASAATRSVNPQRAMAEVVELAYGATPPACDLLLINAGVGHDLQALSEAAQSLCPGARVLASSCAGVVGREGPGESAHDIAVMGLSGLGFTVAHVDGLYGDTSFSVGAQLAAELAAGPGPVSMMYLLGSGIDTSNDQLIAGIESVLGSDVVIFGATSSDQMRGVATFQAVDGKVFQHSAFAVGIWDSTLEVVTQATHGFVAVGDPMTVTAAEGNRIVELDGQPAWSRYLQRLGLPSDATEADTIPIGALAERLSADVAAEYGNAHMLRVVTQHTDAGEIVYATSIAPGTKLWLTTRDEDLIFRDMDRMLESMTAAAPGQAPVAVFQADCLARGRRLFDVVMKEELVHRMQAPFSPNGVPPAWLGMYGFGEYARLNGRNEYHNYTTALAALYRRS